MRARPMLLAGKIVIVSGVGVGLGRQVALACAREGSSVVLAARTAEHTSAIAAEIRGLGGAALPVMADITKPEECQRLVTQAADEFGRLDCLVNNAARGAFVP